MIHLQNCFTDSIKSRQNKGEKATDDFHYEKFKKQVRRYWHIAKDVCLINSTWIECKFKLRSQSFMERMWMMTFVWELLLGACNMFNLSGSKWSLRFVHSLHYQVLTNIYLNLRLTKRHCFQSCGSSLWQRLFVVQAVWFNIMNGF